MSDWLPGLPTDRLLLPALRDVWGEKCWWLRPDTDAWVGPILGRFRIDPFDAALGSSLAPGVNSTQTWFYTTRADVPDPERAPGMGDYFFIRADYYEVVQLDADDIGELGYRLLRAINRDADPANPVSRTAAR